MTTGELTLVFEGTAVFTEADNGAARIAEFVQRGAPDNAVFVRLHSWDEAKSHPEARHYAGKRLRITIAEV